VKYLYALISGVIAAVLSILIHQSIPPIGVISALIFSFGVIWLVGRLFHARSYKVIAAIGWLAALLRGSTFGEGQELLVQGDGVGVTLLLLGTLVVLFAVAARN
jgi:hypothetical protein